MSTGLGYLAYMLRLWRVEDDETPCWRASLETPHTGERRVFASLEALFVYLRAEMDAGAAPVPAPPASQDGSGSGDRMQQQVPESSC
jgi:hypothetical protein